ncbi:hypothetical protein ACWEO4_46775 [Streptomyces sp. NPDC004393]
MAPELVVEVRVDIARDSAGCWRHSARLHRSRPDVPQGAVPQWLDGEPATRQWWRTLVTARRDHLGIDQP